MTPANADSDAIDDDVGGPIPLAYRVFEEFLEEGRQATERWARPISFDRLGDMASLPGLSDTAQQGLRAFIDALEQLNDWSRLLQRTLAPASSHRTQRRPPRPVPHDGFDDYADDDNASNDEYQAKSTPRSSPQQDRMADPAGHHQDALVRPGPASGALKDKRFHPESPRRPF